MMPALMMTATLLLNGRAQPAYQPRSAFFSSALDRDGDGQLSLRELYLLRSMTSHSTSPSLASTGSAELAANADADGDGFLSLQEFWGGGGSSSLAQPQAPNATLDGQVHLALTGVASQMRVSWVTHEAYRPGSATVDVSIVGTRHPSVIATTAKYTVPKREWDPDGSGGFIHTAVLTGLPPDATVSYRAHGLDARGRIQGFGPHEFHTAPSPPSKTTKIALLADQGTFMGFGSEVTAAMIRDFGPYTPSSTAWPSLIHHGGDISCVSVPP